jgi:SH3 domain protein
MCVAYLFTSSRWKMNRVATVVAIVVGVLSFGQEGWASKAYVTDSFEITLRTEPSSQKKIIGLPVSGQPVEVLDSQGEWSLVRLLGGTDKQGWVATRYLITRQPWEMQAKALKQENTELEARLDQVERELNEKVEEGQALKTKLEEATGSLESLRGDYESLKRESEGYLKLKEAHGIVQARVKRLEEEVKRLTGEKEDLASSQVNRWFAIGALVLLCGLMIGLIVGKQQKKQRSVYK